MKKKAPLIGYSLIFLGIAFLTANTDALFNMYYLHYVSIIVGIVILLIYYLTTRSEKIYFAESDSINLNISAGMRRLHFVLFIVANDVVAKKVIRSSGGGV